MTISLTCGGCGASYSFPDTAAGRKVRCKRCGTVSPLPSSEPSDAEAAPLRESSQSGFSRGERAIVCAGAVAVLVIALLGYYFISFRDRWERQHRESLLTLKAEADTLAAKGNLGAAEAKYAQLLGEVQGHTLRDDSLKSEVDSARVEREHVREEITIAARKAEEAKTKLLAAQRLEAEQRAKAEADRKAREEALIAARQKADQEKREAAAKMQADREAAARKAAEDKKAVQDAILLPVHEALDKGSIAYATLTPKFNDMVMRGVEIGVMFSPTSVSDYTIKSYTIDQGGRTATVDASVKYGDANGSPRERTMTFYLVWVGKEWAVNGTSFSEHSR